VYLCVHFAWQIEMYFKVLKSGFRVEACRLGTAERLIRYLTVMGIVAWRLFMITLIARTNPSLPCSQFLSEQEWRVLAQIITEWLPTYAFTHYCRCAHRDSQAGWLSGKKG